MAFSSQILNVLSFSDVTAINKGTGSDQSCDCDVATLCRNAAVVLPTRNSMCRAINASALGGYTRTRHHFVLYTTAAPFVHIEMHSCSIISNTSHFYVYFSCIGMFYRLYNLCNFVFVIAIILNGLFRTTSR